MTIELVRNLVDDNNVSMDKFLEQTRHLDLQELETLVQDYKREIENEQTKSFKRNFEEQMKKYRFITPQDNEELSKMSLEIDEISSQCQNELAKDKKELSIYNDKISKLGREVASQIKEEISKDADDALKAIKEIKPIKDRPEKPKTLIYPSRNSQKEIFLMIHWYSKISSIKEHISPNVFQSFLDQYTLIMREESKYFLETQNDYMWYMIISSTFICDQESIPIKVFRDHVIHPYMSLILKQESIKLVKDWDLFFQSIEEKILSLYEKWFKPWKKTKITRKEESHDISADTNTNTDNYSDNDNGDEWVPVKFIIAPIFEYLIELSRLVSPGLPDQFQKCFKSSIKFIDRLVMKHFIDEALEIERNENVIMFLRSWPLSVYFQIRTMEIENALKEILINSSYIPNVIVSDNNNNNNNNNNSSNSSNSNRNDIITDKTESNQVEMVKSPLNLEECKSDYIKNVAQLLKLVWSENIIIKPLISKFIRLTIQIIGRVFISLLEKMTEDDNVITINLIVNILADVLFLKNFYKNHLIETINSFLDGVLCLEKVNKGLVKGLIAKFDQFMDQSLIILFNRTIKDCLLRLNEYESKPLDQIHPISLIVIMMNSLKSLGVEIKDELKINFMDELIKSEKEGW